MEDFLREFHLRRREEAMAERGIGGWMRRLGQWFAAPGAAKWAYGAGAAYAAVMLMVVLAPREQEVIGPAGKDAQYREIVPVESGSVEQLQQLDLRPESQGTTGEQEF